MYVSAGTLVVSPSDLTGFLACRELSALDAAAARGLLPAPERDDPELEAVRARGIEHERAYLQRLRDEGRAVVELPSCGPSVGELHAAEEATVAAMRSGAEVIYQATFFDGRWRGHADFLVRVERPSALGTWSYEVVDTKLARRVKGSALLQLCVYAEQVARVQGVEPTRLHVVGGDGRSHAYRFADVAAYYRTVKAAFDDWLDEAVPAPAAVDPVAHCRLCRWEGHCEGRRRSEDHLSLIAGMRRAQGAKLRAAGLRTVEALATAGERPIAGIGAPVLARLREQAALQLEQRRTGAVRAVVVTPPQPGQGLLLLPEPSPGDLFFDMEGDPFVDDDGLEYLFGVVALDGGEPAFQAFWAHDAAAEKRAFEFFVDLVVERRRRHPTMHVFHYASYEKTALRRLMTKHATREDEVDELLRGEVFVDLYQVVRQGVRVSQESYSLKRLEPLYMAPRDGDIKDAASSIVAYEAWLASRSDALLEAIESYNRLDCESTWLLRDWLETQRAALERDGGVALERPSPVAGVASPEALDISEQVRARFDALVKDLPDGGTSSMRAHQEARLTLAHLLDWHRREAKPAWWAYFDRLDKSDDDLVEDSEALGHLRYAGPVGSVARSTIHRYEFPTPQEHKIRVGDKVHDPRTRKEAGEVVALDMLAGTVDLRRGTTSKAPHPTSVVPRPPIDDRVLRQALLRVADDVVAHGVEAGGPSRSALDVLLRRGPSTGELFLVRGGELASDAVRRLVPAGGCLAVQGPPGSGKTWTAARVVVDAVASGKRVAVAATNHKAIGNVLCAIADAAVVAGCDVRILQKASEGDGCGIGECTDDNTVIEQRVRAGTVDVVGGTPWLFARAELVGAFDLLVVDEAGQCSLANVVAIAPVARQVVLFGDPQQLPQPSQGVHPRRAAVSALEHFLDGDATVGPDRGVLLDVSYRMAPGLCRFVSDAFYDGRLTPAEGCDRQVVLDGDWAAGAGVGWRPVEHTGNRSTSPEEVAAVAEGVSALVGRPWIDASGTQRRLTLQDILVVAPYNAQVAALQAALPQGARVGTVDKFQGQEAAVVIYSMTSSSADDLPRAMEFLFSANRLNVALSRARALAVVVASPALLEVRCRTPQQMQLVNPLCRLAEEAQAASRDRGLAPAMT